MATPRVFVSSTCYDLKYIRENLKYFISDIGYESILSDEGDVYYDPDVHTHEACIEEVCTSQLFVLIIGGRFGGKYLDSDKSITNREYEEAVRLKIPVFTLVEKNVLSEHLVYQKNKSNKNSEEIIYPSVDNVNIFEFINEVRKYKKNNAFFPFSNFADIKSYLKKQWAGMMFNYLTNSIETKKIEELFDELHIATDKIEYYTKQVALNVGDNITNLLIKIYETMINKEIVQKLGYWNIKATPQNILINENLDEICSHNIMIDGGDEWTIISGGPPFRCTRFQYEEMKRKYEELREEILSILEENQCTIENFLAESEKN